MRGSNGPRGRDPGGTAVSTPCLGLRLPWREPGRTAHTAACGSGRRAEGLAVSRNILVCQGRGREASGGQGSFPRTGTRGPRSDRESAVAFRQVR